MKKTVIIGAGVTGLRVGAQLAREGHSVTVIEKSPKVGGMCASFRYNDFILDYGPHKFYTQLPGVYDDFKRIVGKDNYVVVKKKNSVRLVGSYFDFPIKLSQLMLKMPLTLAIQVLFDFMIAQMHKMEIKSYEDYFTQGFGKKGFDILFRGFAEKVWGDPKSLSEELARRRAPVSTIFDLMKSMLFKDKDVSADYFYYPRKGYGMMGDKLAEEIKNNGGTILLSTEPLSIHVKKNKVTHVEITSRGIKKKIACDTVVSSLAIHQLPGLIDRPVPATIKRDLEGLKFRSLIICYVFLKKKRALSDNWIFFPEKEFVFNRVAEQKSFSTETAPADKTVITAEITCDYGDAMHSASDVELRKKVIADLIRAGLIKTDEVFDFFTRRASRVYPVYEIGYKEKLSRVLEYLDTFPSLYTVGRLGLFNYNNADHCLDMGRVTAELILANAHRSEWKKARAYFDSYRIVD